MGYDSRRLHDMKRNQQRNLACQVSWRRHADTEGHTLPRANLFYSAAFAFASGHKNGCKRHRPSSLKMSERKLDSYSDKKSTVHMSCIS